MYALCSQIDEAGICLPGEAVKRFLLALPAAFFALVLLFRAVLPMTHRQRCERKTRFCTFWAFALLFLAYVPMFLIEYPGSFRYDAQQQTFQIANRAYNVFHPLLHTLLLEACLSTMNAFGSLEKSAALYSLVQMALLSGCFALTAASVSRMRSRRAGRLTLLFFMLYPAHMAFASNCAKDVLFSGFFALFLAYSLETLAKGKLSPLHAVLHVVSGVLACLLRNNMIYAMAAWTAVILLSGRKLRRLALCALLTTALSFGVQSGLRALTRAAEGSVGEMLSVPAQQLARARMDADERLTEGEKQQIAQFIPTYALYQPDIADPVKNSVNADMLKADPKAILSLWLEVGKKCPDAYLNAFLGLTLPSLYPYRSYPGTAQYIEIGLSEEVLSKPFGQEPMNQPGRFASVRRWLEENIFADGADGIPVVKWLFNCGAVFWLLFLLFLYSVYRGEWTRTAALFLPVLLWGTYLLGPVMQGRYLYPFLCALPLFFVIFGSREGEDADNKE